MNLSRFLTLSLLLGFLPLGASMVQEAKVAQSAQAVQPVQPAQEKVIGAYVVARNNIMPDPTYITHINYAFGHVNDTFNGVRIENEDKLRAIVALKEHHPKLKVLLSIGGWKSGRFSEMAATKKTRVAFAADCQRVVKEFGLDGIDLDWEYPTSSIAGISSSKRDTRNFTLLVKELRKAIGKDKLLTFASVCSAKYVNFKAIRKQVDFVNIMSYDMSNGETHHAALYPSNISGKWTTSQSIEAHLKAGIPENKIVVGIPFYGRGLKEYYYTLDYKYIEDRIQGLTKCWDNQGKVPYFSDSTGRYVFGYEDPQSIEIKCQYINSLNLRGAMYWEYSADNEQGHLREAVYKGLLGK